MPPVDTFCLQPPALYHIFGGWRGEGGGWGFALVLKKGLG